MLKIILAITLAALFTFIGVELFSDFVFEGCMMMAGPVIAALFLLLDGVSDVKLARKYK